MIKFYFRNGLRSLLRFKSAALINLIGLSLGFSAIMMLGFMLYQYLTIDQQLANRSQIYYLKIHAPDGLDFQQAPFPFMDEVLQTCPDIVAGTHIQNSGSNAWLRYGNKEFQDYTTYVDSNFFRVFPYPLETGDPKTALRNKYNVVLGEEMAVKLFGSPKAAQGKTLRMDDSLHVTVTGVLQPVPANSSFNPKVLLTTSLLKDNNQIAKMLNWYNFLSPQFYLLRPGTDSAKINAQLRQLALARFIQRKEHLVPFLMPYAQFPELEYGNLNRVLVKGLMGAMVLLLLVVVANLINLNAATLLSRQKEMAVRKMVGGGRIQILLQFVFENALIVGASVVIAFSIFHSLLIPAVNGIGLDQFGSLSVNFRHDYPLAGLFLILALAVVVLAGSFPAAHFGTLRPVDALKGRVFQRGERHYTRNVFITLQFALALVVIDVAIVLNGQIRHMKTAALGFDKDHVLVVPLDLAFRDRQTAASRYHALVTDLRQDPSVEGLSSSWDIPTDYHAYENEIVDPATGRMVDMVKPRVDDGYFSTFHIPLVEGRDFNGANDSLDRHNVVINELAMRRFGWTHAVGRQLKEESDTVTYTVIGVVRDFYYGDLSQGVQPLFHQYQGHDKLGGYLSIRVRPGHEQAVAKEVAAGFQGIPSRKPFDYGFLSDRVDKQYASLDGILQVAGFVAMLTIMIAAMGLFGLIAAFTRQRVKEVGIRKVLGAGVGNIVSMLSRNYLLLIGIAFAIASPLAFWAMRQWLQDFAYRVDIAWWMFAGAGGIAAVIAGLTIGFHAVRAARANPVESLRAE